MKFHKKGSGEKAAKKAHTSPMQKKGWAKDMSLEEATACLVVHVEKGLAWSGDDLLYLNAIWDATQVVAEKLGYIDHKED